MPYLVSCKARPASSAQVLVEVVGEVIAGEAGIVASPVVGLLGGLGGGDVDGDEGAHTVVGAQRLGDMGECLVEPVPGGRVWPWSSRHCARVNACRRRGGRAWVWRRRRASAAASSSSEMGNIGQADMQNRGSAAD